MEETLTKDSVEKWRSRIEKTKDYNQTQKNVLLRRLEELEKKL